MLVRTTACRGDEPVTTVRRERMDATGIGFAGIDGAWWRPATTAVRWPPSAAERLREIGDAVFTLLGAVQDLYPRDTALAALLEYRVPVELRAYALASPVLALRPDFQVVTRDGALDFVATELEICPSAHGFAHAMQRGYGLAEDLVDAYRRLAAGRELLFVGSSEWSEFIIEQLAFCRALQEAGCRARVLYDRPLAAIAGDFAAGRIWQPPMFGLPSRGGDWNDDLLARLREHDLLRAAWVDDDDWPETLDDTLVFRFGYLECFTERRRVRMTRWQQQGTAFVNPTHFALESKCVMAALGLPSVRDEIAARDGEALAVLDRCIPETRLLSRANLDAIAAQRPQWLTKYAGFDASNRAWGGRSLVIGESCDDAGWRESLQQAVELPWPVVAQRLAHSQRDDVDWLDETGGARRSSEAVSRLRSFLLRDGEQAVVCGSHLTWDVSTRVSEGSEAVQAPVSFG